VTQSANAFEENTINVNIIAAIRITIHFLCMATPSAEAIPMPRLKRTCGAYTGTLSTTVITLMFLFGCLLSLLVINRLGRRSLLLHSFFWSGLALLALGLFPNISPTLILTLFCIDAVFIGGSQVLQFIYPNELFPTEIRAAAVWPRLVPDSYRGRIRPHLDPRAPIIKGNSRVDEGSQSK
jgi:MFS family permease